MGSKRQIDMAGGKNMKQISNKEMPALLNFQTTFGEWQKPSKWYNRTIRN